MAHIVERKTKIVVGGSDVISDEKSIQESRNASIQSRAHDSADIGLGGVGIGGLLTALFRAGELVAPWWSTQRDIDLRRFVKSSDHLSGAVALLTSKVVNVPVHVEPRDFSLKTHIRQADEHTRRLMEESEFGQGWITLASKVLDDWFTCDAGLAMEVIGDGPKDGPIQGPALGLAALDSTRCIRKKDSEYPLSYLDEDGMQYKLHYTRVAYASDQPSNIVEMRGIGFASVSRTINVSQHLVDILTFNQEKLGSRPMRAVMFTPGIPTDVVQATLQMAAEAMDNQGLRRYSKIPILGGNDTDARFELISLSNLPDGFDQETNVRLAMFAMALGFGVPIRWIWPAATTGATKADAMYQHIAGLGGGIGRILNVLTLILGGDPKGSRHTVGKFLPPHLKLIFDFQDDEQDRMHAEVQKQRMESIATGMEIGAYTLRVAREKMLEAGDLTEAQFDQMELADGRLPGGEDVLTLFYAGDDSVKEMLELGIDDPLDVARNDAARMVEAIEDQQAEVRKILSEASAVSRKRTAKEALAALGKLREAYEKGVSAQQEADDAETEDQAVGRDQPETEVEEKPERERESESQIAEGTEDEAEDEAEKQSAMHGARKAWEWIRDRVKGGTDTDTVGGVNCIPIAESSKVWSSLSEVPKHLRTMHGAPLTLDQINHVARIGDAIEARGGVKNPWAAARTQFQKIYKVENGHWVRREEAEGEKGDPDETIDRTINRLSRRLSDRFADLGETAKKGLSDLGGRVLDRLKGGPGSGNWGHAGRAGQVGGSLAGSGGSAWNIHGYAKAVRIAAAGGKEGPKAVLDAIREVRPDATPGQVDMYLDVMALDRERFEYYADKLGIKGASHLADVYFADMKAVDRETATKVQVAKDRATYRRDPESKYPEFMQSISGELIDAAMGEKVGGSASEAKEMLKDEFGISVLNVSGESDDTIHEHASWLYNMAQADPRIAVVLGRVEKIMFIPQVAGSTAAMDVTAFTIKIHENAFGHTPSMYVHELGHILENISDDAFTRFMRVGGGRGRMYSSYGFSTPSEDFAEAFVSLFSGLPGVEAWAPDKYDFVQDEVEVLL